MQPSFHAMKIAAIATLFSVSAASASDLGIDSRADAYEPAPAQAASDWTGPYVGVFGGYGWAERATSLNDGFDVEVFDPSSVETDGEGWLGGVAAGVNVHDGIMLLGVEGDIAMTGIEGDDLIGTPKFYDHDGEDGTAWGKEFQVDYLATLRGRAGVVFGDKLIYATGGVAWARVEETHTVQDGDSPIHATSKLDVDHFGWTAGGGLEWQFKPGWSLKTEYLYVDLGKADYAHDVGNDGGSPDLTSADLDLHTVKVGINHRF